MIFGREELLISHLVQHGVFFLFSFVIFLNDLSEIGSLRYIIAILTLLSCFQISRWSQFVLIRAWWWHLKHSICLSIHHTLFIVASSRDLPCHQRRRLSFLGILIYRFIINSTKRTRNRKALLCFSLMDSIVLIGICLALSIHDIRQIRADFRHIFFFDMWIHVYIQVLISLLLGGLFGSMVLVFLHFGFCRYFKNSNMYKKIRNKIYVIRQQ